MWNPIPVPRFRSPQVSHFLWQNETTSPCADPCFLKTNMNIKRQSENWKSVRKNGSSKRKCGSELRQLSPYISLYFLEFYINEIINYGLFFLRALLRYKFTYHCFIYLFFIFIFSQLFLLVKESWEKVVRIIRK